MTTNTQHPAVQPTKRPVIGRLSLLAACTIASIGFFTSAGTAAAQEMPERGSSETTPVPGFVPETDAGIDRTSAALGALAGIALAGVGFGVTLTVQHHRDHPGHPA
jgi:hypothetical protein